ncbi:hypothetical protein RN001_006659 [Aquatica leii]|uniref:tRNA (guanosine(18)-2'-O)-methyltransferase TARBP1 n=1 Tax=Aquatica leii TaxID=1421715 RepID=A0AAN7Q901_9COLE|nr:hypothetical protein RN001_006659 [Aquatica leii]
MAFANNNMVDVLQLTHFFNAFITEEQLNQQIRSTQDFTILRSLLEIKLHLIHTSKHSSFTYSINFILNEFSNVNTDELCYIMKIALMVQEEVSEYLTLLQFIKNSLSQSADSIKYLKLLEIAVILCKFDKEENAFVEFIDCNHFDDVIFNLIKAGDKVTNNYLNINILPAYLNLNSESSKRLFQLILKHSFETKSLDIFCAVSKVFVDNNEILLKDDCFWYLLQDGLNNNSTIVQKQALYLLKGALNVCQRLDNFSTATGVVHWHDTCKNDIVMAWHNLIMLYEVVREKQIHLIEPIYHLIPTIKVLHPSWLSSIFRILLLHPQQTVCTYILFDLLKSNWFYDNTVFKDVVRTLIHVLNKTEFALQRTIWIHLLKFSQNLHNEKFLVLLEESANISWIPSVCYRFYNAIFNSQVGIFVPISLCTQLVSNLRKLPHKFIRDECMRITIDYIHQAHFQQVDFNGYLELNKLFFKDNFRLWRHDNIEKFIPDIQKLFKSNDEMDLKQIEGILYIIQSINNNILEDLLYDQFINNQLSAAVRDRLCILFYVRNKNVVPYLENRLLSIQEDDDAYLRFIASVLKPDSNEILNTCLGILLNDANNEVQVEICFSILNSLLNEIKDTETLEKILLKWEGKFLNNENCNSNTCFCFIRIFSKKRFNSALVSKTKHIFENLLETQDSFIVPEIFAQLKFLVDASQEVATLFPFIDLCTRKLLELKGTKFFKLAAENFISSVVLNNAILKRHNESMMVKCKNLLRVLFDCTSSSEDLGLSLSRNLRKLSELNSQVAFKFISVALKLLVFGDILKKDQRAEYQVCQIISQTNLEKGVKNPNLRKTAIRGEIIVYIQNILNEDEEKADVISALLLKKYSLYVNKRCFSDSQVHLIKLRILQALLLIHDKMNDKEQLIDSLLNSLCTESHQPSNKFIIIWLLIRLLHANDNCLEIISAKIQSTSKVHSSTISAFIPVLYHIAVLKNDNSFWIKVFKQLLPWTMGAHFNLRLYAQVGIKKLYEVLYQMGKQEICVKFEEVVDGVVEVLNKTEREIEPIDKYIFDTFKPITDFNRQTIYYIIPHITNVTNDEYENIPNFFNCASSTLPHLDYLRRVRLKSTKEINESVGISIIQKKIIPQDSSNRKTGELILVATLIDKVPNLGGLSRTSEIFGVKKLVISSLAITKNPEFQNLSMSSENWINIAEVKPDQLQSFLLSAKERGYCVVGAEQTSESVKLNNFKFPYKCLLLLGNEKEGIPPNLLSLIDTCVEIPQLGVVRSLNVHVAAATFIWEYTKVHVL